MSKNVDIINAYFSNHREARPQTQPSKQSQPNTEYLLTYEQLLLLHQAHAGISGDGDTSATASSSGPVRPSNRYCSDNEPLVFRNTEDRRLESIQPPAVGQAG